MAGIRMVEPTLISDCSTTTGWAVVAGGTLGTGSVVLPEGNNATRIKLTGDTSTNAFFDCTLVLPVAGKQGVEFDFFLESPAHQQIGPTGNISLRDNSGNSFTANVMFRDGWNQVRLHRGDFNSISGSPNWETTSFVSMRMKLNAVSGMQVAGYVSNLSYPGYARPQICLMFDDGLSSALTTVAPILQNHGLSATGAVISGLVATSGKLTEAQLATLQDTYSWSLTNHSKTHGAQPFLISSTQAECLSEIKACQQFLSDRGLGKDGGNLFYCAPYGESSDAYVAAARQAGCLVFRRTMGTDTTTPTCPSSGDRRMNTMSLPCFAVNSSTSLADLTAVIDSAIRSGRSQVILFHDIVASPSASSDFSTANFTSFAQHCFRKKALCDFVSLPQLYAKLAA